jgi:Uma2 family endonuclease
MERMTATLHSPEQRVTLHNISWDLYESLLLAHPDSVPRFIYDRGELEIVSPSADHEQLARRVAHLVHIMAEELGVNAEDFGSTTFRLKPRQRGFEPDTCFYIDNLNRVRGKKKIDLQIDPPPDLVIEIDITSSSLDKLSIIAALGAPEVLQYESGAWRILGLDRGKYVERTSSASFPALTAETLRRLIDDGWMLEPLEWTRHVRDWIRSA